MAVLRPLDKLPSLNTATILVGVRGPAFPATSPPCLCLATRVSALRCSRAPSCRLVGTEDALLQQLADLMLKEDCTSELKIHLAKSLPLPSNVNRPRIDLIIVPLRPFPVTTGVRRCCKDCPLLCLRPCSGHPSLQKVEESLRHVDAPYFLGKVVFLVTGALQDRHCSVHRSTVAKLARTYRSPLLSCDLETETFRAAVAQRLVRLLQICAGHVPGLSALSLLSLLRSRESSPPEDLGPSEGL
ncbi:Centromere protein M [Galemys pyrenaicus]|uniref:Centromere protein M n=1 Tax=Galemys pyrenaicus TaxID=202257 RepID=A0A8J6ABA5_GALPY|nr:Centromere protein M [Galemys pyrenaicus]